MFKTEQHTKLLQAKLCEYAFGAQQMLELIISWLVDPALNVPTSVTQSSLNKMASYRRHRLLLPEAFRFLDSKCELLN